MDTLDDLLIRRRRGALSEAEQRRLRSGLRASPEHELSLLAGDVFERDGAALPGDAERLRRLVSAALPRASVAQPRWRWPRVRLWVAAPLFVAAAAAASVGGYRALGRWGAAARELGSPPPSLPGAGRGGVETRTVEPAPDPAALQASVLDSSVLDSPVLDSPVPPAPVLDSTVPPAPALAPPEPDPSPPALARERPARAARVVERARGRRRPQPTPSTPGRAAPSATAEAAPLGRAPAPAAPESASAAGSEGAAELFRRASAARRTDWSGAAALYVELVRLYPGSTEAGVAEVALGKWALTLGRGGDALEWFRAHQRRGPGPLAAEALWGEARALESIGSHAAARQPWQRLLEAFPGSPYARVARERLAP
jgi:GcrA cell cycle regulator